MLLLLSCLIVTCIGYAAASARREPVARGKTLKEEARLILGGAALVILAAYFWQQGLLIALP